MKSLLSLTFISLVFFSCQNEAPKEATPKMVMPNAEATMTIKSEKFIRTEGNCDKICANLEVSFPEVKGGNSDFQMAVQEWVMAWVRDNAVFSEEKKPKRMTLEETAVAFVGSFKKDLKENSKYARGFEVQNSDTVLCQNAKVVSLRMDCYSDMGGAHPNYQASIANFDPNTGGPIFVNKVIKDDKAILKMLETKYIALKTAQSGESFKIQTDNGKLTFPTNWGYTEKGVLFHYNTYEVGSYAIGDADIFMTWEEMGAAAEAIK
jgi:predicted transport protein